MSRRNRTASHFQPRYNSSFSKTAYMFPDQRHLSSTYKRLKDTKSTFFEERQRSLTNSVLDYKNKLNETMPNTHNFLESQSVEKHVDRAPKQILVKNLQRPMTGNMAPARK